MSTVLAQVGYAVLGAILGAFFSLWLPLLIGYIKYRRRKEILGTWKSIYRPDFKGQNEWILEDVMIEAKSGKFRMTNRNNPSEDLYEVECELYQRSFIIGHWNSKRPGANAIGAIVLTVHPLGDLMYGYFVGPGDTGERIYCAWILSRQDDGLIKGIDLLSKSMHLGSADEILSNAVSVRRKN